MQATGEDLHAAIVALTLLMGVMLARDPDRDDALDDYRRSLDALDEHPEWSPVAGRAKAYGETMLANLRAPVVAKPRTWPS
jgi:hypothetical protein